jgi:hypothetical protein
VQGKNARQATAGRGLFVARTNQIENRREACNRIKQKVNGIAWDDFQKKVSALPSNSGSFDDLGRNPSRLIFGEQRCCLPARSPARPLLEIDIGERLSVVVAHDKIG